VKIDLTKLPVGEAIIGFLLFAVIATFVLAFVYVDPLVDEPGDEPAPSVTSGGGETAEPGDIRIVMEDNSFDPGEFTVVSGEEASVAVVNEGTAIHNVRIAGVDGDYDTDDDIISDPDTIRGGDSGVIAWTPEAPGEQDFRCDFHPTEMTGTITVQ
jgi:plastocyanin